MKWFLNYFVILNTFCFTFSFSDAAYPPVNNCPPPQLEHGRVRARLRARLVRFVCLPGYELVGNKYATCNGGEWDVPIPVCVRPGCPPLRSIDRGIQLQSHRNAYTTFYCESGHQLTGSPVLYCNGSKWNSTMPVCVDTRITPNLTCDFESSDLCGWKDDEYHDFDWRWFSKKTPSYFMNTGPSYDHTKGVGGAGHYLYAESTGRQKYDKARLLSPIYEARLGREGCFSFYYHMFGKTTGSLRVYVKPVSMDLATLVADSESDLKKFDKSGNQGDNWYREIFDLPHLNENFQIVIEAVRGTSFTSDIAIDDVELMKTGEDCMQAKRSIQPVILPSPSPLDSCAGRCGSGRLFSEQGDMFECSCDESCMWEGSCCADFRDLCESFAGDVSMTPLMQSEPAPQTMKLEATTPPTYYRITGTSSSVRPSTTAQTSTTTETTTTTETPSTTTTTTPSTSTKTTAITTLRTTILRTTTTTTTVKPTTISKPKIVFKTPTPEPFNATGQLHKINMTKNNEIQTNTTSKSAMINSTTFRTTTVKVIKKTGLATKITPKTTIAPVIKHTTKYDGLVPISRTFENHNTYHELVKAHQDKIKQDAQKAKSADEPDSSWVAAVVGTVVTVCAVAALLVVVARSRRFRWRLERAGGCERTDEVRYLTGDDQLDFESS